MSNEDRYGENLDMDCGDNDDPDVPLSRLVATFESGEVMTLFITRNPKKILTLEWYTLDPNVKNGDKVAKKEDALIKW